VTWCRLFLNAKGNTDTHDLRQQICHQMIALNMDAWATLLGTAASATVNVSTTEIVVLTIGPGARTWLHVGDVGHPHHSRVGDVKFQLQLQPSLHLKHHRHPQIQQRLLHRSKIS